MAKTPNQIEAERKQKIEERRKYLIENPSVYRKDFEEAFKTFLARKYPAGLDPEDCDNRFDPDFRENFTWSQEGRELSLQYNLDRVWDPDGDKPPSPVILSAAKSIRCQDDRIWSNQIQKDSIINLPPYKVFGRFLIAEIDLSYPRRKIYADIMAQVDHHRKKLKISGPYHELVDRPEPRGRDNSYSYKPMEVWKMVEEKRGTFNKSESKILSQLAKERCELEGWDKNYEKFEDDPDIEERVKVKRKALKSAYQRDKALYYGEVIFRAP